MRTEALPRTRAQRLPHLLAVLARLHEEERQDEDNKAHREANEVYRVATWEDDRDDE